MTIYPDDDSYDDEYDDTIEDDEYDETEEEIFSQVDPDAFLDEAFDF